MGEEVKTEFGAVTISVGGHTTGGRDVRTSQDWGIVFDVYADALLYIWPERLRKLTRYKRHINGLFWAYRSQEHTQNIDYDKAVRTFFVQTRDFLLHQHERYYELKDIWLGAAVPFTAIQSLLPAANNGSLRNRAAKACRKYNAGTCNK